MNLHTYASRDHLNLPSPSGSKVGPPRTLIGSQMPKDHIETFTKVFELSLIFEDFEMKKAILKYILIPLT